MASHIHNKIICKMAKTVFEPLGLFQKGNSRLWIDDNGWFLTVVEFQPCFGKNGTFLNVAIFFLWVADQDYISFDFGNREYGYVEYNNDEEQFSKLLQPMLKVAIEKVLFYRQCSDLTFAKKKILAHTFTSEEVWGIWHKAMLSYFANDIKKGDKFISRLNFTKIERWNREVAEFLELQIKQLQNSPDEIKNCIVNSIKIQRALLRSSELKKLKIDDLYG